MSQWQNRIIGYGEVDPLELLANPKNWRIHPKDQQDGLQGVLDEVGIVQNIIVNQTTGFVVDGHLRVQLALRTEQKLIPVTYVELDESEEDLILSTLDPIAAMAATDRAKLDDLFKGVQSDNAQVQKMMADIAEREKLEFAGLDEKYTRNIEAPIYKPTGDKPEIKNLYDDSKSAVLLSEIDSSNLPENEKEFLRVAARRHTVINYKRVAEYYAHSDKNVQGLMENSALVIIDFEKAIELGYIKLSEEIASQYAKDYGDDG